jgi:hypothetical protein
MTAAIGEGRKPAPWPGAALDDGSMKRTIDHWTRDDEGDWVAALSCLHSQHVRHRPPFRVAPWVESAEGRSAHLGTDVNCPLCDRTELPQGLEVVRTTDTWDESSMPAGLRRHHRVAARRWARLHVSEGRLRFRAETDPAIDRVLSAGVAADARRSG